MPMRDPADMLGGQNVPPSDAARLSILGILMCCVLALLSVRLWYLQLEEGQSFRARSERNRLRLQRVPAVRGKLYDRMGRALAENLPSFDVVFRLEDIPDLEHTLLELASYLPDGQLLSAGGMLLHDPRRPAYSGIVAARDVDWPIILAVESRQHDFAGVSIETRSKRSYPMQNLAAHILGYVGEVSQRELEQSPGYRRGDVVGKFGVEKTWDADLRGQSGGQQLEVDASGRRLRTLEEVPAQTGHSLILTIDMDLQKQVEAVLGEKPGAMIALDVNSGEILALASAPSFDPGIFARGITTEEWRVLRDDPLHPLTNRATQGQYPPASTFKIISAAAALEEGVVTPDMRFYCPGRLRVAGRTFHCWRRRGHGSVNLRRALAVSCDVYFYQLGRRLGIQHLADYARRFGLDKPLGIGLAYEAGGTIPDPAWKQKRIGDPWYPGETISAVIGQGYVTATPLQMAAATAAIANGGTVYRPHIVKQVIDVRGHVVKSLAPEVVSQIGISPEYLQVITEGMTDVVHKGYGTGKRARVRNVRVAGKTGTAQTISGRSGSSKRVARRFRDHAWFVAFAPAEAPKIAVACLLEHAAQGGGAAAAPLVQKVLKAYFSLVRERGRTQGVRQAAYHPF
jgi:penicillin-binding protein 2